MSDLREWVKNKQELIGLFLVPLPILSYWVYWTLNPSYWFNADPAALYFIDSLSVFIGKSYVYVDHPGTPMQVIGSALLALTYPFFENRAAFISFFISRPNAFFLMTNVFLLAANLFCAILFYRTVVASLTQNRVLAALSTSLMFFTLHPHSYPSLTFWSHNSINYPIGTVLLIWLYRELRSPEGVKPAKLMLLGFASGVLAVAQMYFIAWLVGGVFTILVYSIASKKNFKQAAVDGLYISLGGLLGIISMLIPIYRELPRFVTWLTGIVTHLGLYGSGESGIYSLSLITLSAAYWWANIRLMMILLLFVLIILTVFASWQRRTNSTLHTGDFAMVLGLLFHAGLVLLLMTKAALKLRYSLSLAAVLPVLVFLVLKLLESTPWRLKILLNAFYILILAGVVTSLAGQKESVDIRAYTEQDAQLAKSQAVNRLARELKVGEEHVAVVYTFSVPLKCAGLLQASNWTGYFKEEIGAICPNQFAIWDSTIDLNTAQPVKEIDELDWDMVIWPGNGTNLPDYLYSVGAINIPASWHVPRSKWFFIHSEVARE